MDEGTSLTTENPPDSAPPSPQSFDELYAATRGKLYRALAAITDDRDMATEAIDVGFTMWRRKLRKPSQVAQEVGVMALAYKWAHKQLSKSGSQLSGFRLAGETEEADHSVLERFWKLSVDERALLVLRDVLDWSDDEVGHALGAHGVSMAANSLLARLDSEGVDRDRLADTIRLHAGTFTEPLSRLDAVKTKGTMQKIGAFAGGTALTAAAIVGATSIATNIGSGSPDDPGTVTTVPVAGLGTALSAENAVWQQIPPPVSGDNIMALAHDGTDFYLMAQDNQGRPVMMASSNGIDWASIPGPPTDQNMWIQQLVATPEALVAVGQGFDDVRGREAALVFVSNDKETWNRAELPSEESIELDGRVVRLHTWVSSIDVNPSGFTVVGNQGAEFDPEELLRDVVDPELLRHGWGTDEQGLQFYDNEGRVTESMSWDELGLEPELVQLVSGGRSIIWTSSDGIEWEVSAAAAPPGAQGIQTIVANDTVEAALAYGNRGASVWVRSGDGEWARPDIAASLTAMTSWNGQILVAGHDTMTGESGIWSTTDGSTWERGEFPGGGVQQFFASGEGLIAIGWEQQFRALGPAEIHVDDLTVLASSDGRYQVIDADGDTVVEVYEEDVVRGENITINDPDSGEIVVQFDDLAFEQAWEAIYREAEFGADGPPAVNIMISPDGTNWTTIPSEDPNFYPQSLAYGNNSILLFGWSEGDGFFGIGGGGQRLILIQSG
ncbi:MAG: hypothetical protein GY720_03250 [bacterium]|nr:hypothetical protein [bacterium]